MTNPPQGPWGRPQQVPPTERIPQQGTPPPGPTERIPQQAPPEPPTQQFPAPGPAAADQPPAERRARRFVSDPLSIVLILVIVAALGLAALVGGELYARHRANSIVSNIVSCVVQDKADASFGMVPPFLWQHVSKRYTDISVDTAGNQVREAKGMKVNIDIKDVHLQQAGDSAGTIGSLVATFNWSSDGIKRTVQDAIPLFGGIVSGVSTDASAGTIELQGPLGTVTAKPTVTDGAIGLEVRKVTGLGFTLPSESVQPALDVFTQQLMKDYPMGIKADAVEVTNDGVTGRLSTRNATIPANGDDACFTGLG